MNEQIHLVRQYATARGATIRYRPATGVPGAERIAQIERMVNAVWVLSSALGFDLGRKPTIVYHGAPMNPPEAILGAASHVLIESVATTLMIGVSDHLSRAIYQIINRSTTNGTPNLKHLLDEETPESDDSRIDTPPAI